MHQFNVFDLFVVFILVFIFFFSSRRRHTRFKCDWSSDVCSSDLIKQQWERELDTEMAAHLEFAIEENLRRGMPAEEARRQALISFGGVEQAKEQQDRKSVV